MPGPMLQPASTVSTAVSYLMLLVGFHLCSSRNFDADLRIDRHPIFLPKVLRFVHALVRFGQKVFRIGTVFRKVSLAHTQRNAASARHAGLDGYLADLGDTSLYGPAIAARKE